MTPRITVLMARPMRYMEEPRLVTLVISASEAEAFNQVVQIYSKDKLFYRSEQPVLIDEYRRNEHRHFSGPCIVDDLTESLPGVRPRDRTFDALFRL